MKKIVFFISTLIFLAPITSFALEISQGETDAQAKRCGDTLDKILGDVTLTNAESGKDDEATGLH